MPKRGQLFTGIENGGMTIDFDELGDKKHAYMALGQSLSVEPEVPNPKEEKVC